MSDDKELESKVEEEEEEEDEEEDLEKLQAEIARMEAEAARITKETEELEKKKGDPDTGAAAAPTNGGESLVNDKASVYVGQVDYAATPEELLKHFDACGTVERVTIVCDKMTGRPKGMYETSATRCTCSANLNLISLCILLDRICLFGI
jgi:polyadenylate-binding protein 2